MNTSEFWQLIAKIDFVALDGGDENAAVRPLQEALSTKSEAELAAFEEELSQKLYAIDGEAYANSAGDAGNSDDGFLYARCYVVAKGKKFYESVLAQPTMMPKSIDQWCEALLYPHRIAWAAATGRDESEWPFETSVSYGSGSNERLWKRPDSAEG